MRKFFIALALAASFCGAAAAKVTDEQIALGGITIGSTEAYVRQTYGPPKSIERSFFAPRNQFIRDYQYGESFLVSILETDGTVFRMMSMGQKNGIATPAGVKVGDPFTDVISKYGYPDLRQIDGETDYYWYFGEGEKGNLVFHISYGKVTGIVCGKK